MAYKKLKFWFDEELTNLLAQKITTIDPSFKSEEFKTKLKGSLEPLELKDRVERIADALFQVHHSDYKTGLENILKILGPENQSETGMFKEYYWMMPLAKYVEKYGLNHFEASMQAIEEITKRNTGEYAIRPYLEKYPEKTLEQMLEWSKNFNSHVRRLSSEGLRPRLPWAKKLEIFIQNPHLIAPVLENLKDDSSKYVQKSVANCINDILKDQPGFGLDLIKSWTGPNLGKERRWIIKHALRNLLKNESEAAKSLMADLG